MEPLVFQSQTQETDQLFGLTLAVFLVSAISCGILLAVKTRRIPPRYRTLSALLLFVVALVAGGTAWFSQLTSQKLGPVEIGTDYLITPYGKADLADIKNAFIEMDKKPTLFNPGQGETRVRLLLIVENDGKTHVLSEDNYPIQGIMAALRKKVNPGTE